LPQNNGYAFGTENVRQDMKRSETAATTLLRRHIVSAAESREIAATL
jgi:hypothetical protein